MGSLPEAWIAPPELRELRELVRYRCKLSQLRTGLKAQIHAVLGKEGVIPQLTGLWGPAGPRWLDDQQLAAAYQDRIVSLGRLIDHYDTEIRRLDRQIHSWLRDDVGYREIQRIDGIGPVFAAVFTAEIGDVSRFKTPKQLCSWVGVTRQAPRVRRDGEAGTDHQARLRPGAVGGGRSCCPLPRRTTNPRRLPADRCDEREQDRESRRSPQTLDAGLLRAA